ncbi:MAG: AIPR family protein [Candidatus Methanoperedens sp.]
MQVLTIHLQSFWRGYHLYLVFGGVKEAIEQDSLLSKQIESTRKILMDNAYSNNIYEIFDAQKLVDLEKKGEEIIDIINYHKTFKYITEIENNKKLTGYISIINAEEIAKLVKTYQTHLFDANIRDFYLKNDLNSKIFETCINDKESKYFWSFNNGLTITCRKVEELPSDKYRLYGIQIVNGCQTSNALYMALYNKERFKLLSDKPKEELAIREIKELKDITNRFLNPKTSLLVKIIETDDPELIYRITETTNSQTPIKTFSLKANDNIQQNIEQYLYDNNIYYERRVNYYKNQGKKNIISIQKLFQLYCSQILFKPSQVKTNPKSMFQGYYDSVFPSPRVKQMNYSLYLIPIKIDLKINKHIRTLQRSKVDIDPYNDRLMSYGKLHLGCFIIYSILNIGYNEKDLIDNEIKINEVLDDDSKFIPVFNIALENLKKTV